MGIISPGVFGKSPLDKKPKQVGGGLLQPVVLRNLGARNPSDRPGEEMLEGGGIGPRGGGGSRVGLGRGKEADYKVTKVPEEKGWTPTFRQLRPSYQGEPRSGSGRRMEERVSVDTPTGQTVTFDMYRGKANMDFFPTRGGGVVRPPIGQGGFQHTANTFGQVVKSLKSFVRLYKPKSIHYYGANSDLMKLYDRASPQLAEGLGGIHHKDGIHHYIEFGDD